MYRQSITRAHRTAFFLLIDGSGSMAEEIPFRGVICSKAQALATVTNELIFELIERARRTDGIRDYYDVAIWSYSGDEAVRSLLPNGLKLISIEELAALPVERMKRTIDVTLPNGEPALRQVEIPTWVKPTACGLTPMVEALRTARDELALWIAREEHRTSFPPIVFNITDGDATDGTVEELRSVASQIRQLHTEDGNVLLMNIHIGHALSSHTFLPNEEEGAALEGRARLLYDLSSELPDCFTEAIHTAKGGYGLPPYRGMGFNTSISELVTMLNIGSISIKTG
ncbi:MAG: VWA domain-containing protein [Rikenellaceae bacterium]|nr:VWA domain-containing protein [Rikenellaceae bacterium]